MKSEGKNIAAVLDANVIYPAPVRDYLLHLARIGMYDPLWTDAIHEEWTRNLRKNRPEIGESTLVARRRSMDDYFRQSNVLGYESLIDTLSLPDPNDRHVLAAAIKGQAQYIITFNLKDFPPENLSRYDIRAIHPDDFTLDFINAETTKSLEALKNQVKYLKNPPIPIEKVLENLNRCGLTKSVETLKTHLKLKN